MIDTEPETDVEAGTDAEAGADVEAEANTAAGKRRQRWPWRPRAFGTRVVGVRLWVCVVAATLLVALTGLAGTGGWLLYRQHDRDVAAAAALDAARSYAVALTSTDQNSIDQNIKDLLDGATGNFKDTYGKTASRLRKMLIDNKVNTTGTVVDSAVKSVRGDEVDVLLTVKQVITSAAAPQPRTDIVSVSMTMRKVDGRWLAADVLLAGADDKPAS
ncbi:hypothetical protein MINS_28860 [Mycolicibacterium insubricum]|uniref:hypothetical protein n=1 Tax=Mycolicibacterium insubricum TaxID=444597 RepID=UPI0009F40A74|nr:hypothetical protein [Mycolicibacterium insubricum]MCB9441848.1 Mce protein [Mycolicibacterium sp.]MCV7081617.1 Mce protein [Mycolicibacterium insubricum]BBZ67457.1 hypothetical protein MINS_28860 [Mycolicibacterium insubricum]